MEPNASQAAANGITPRQQLLVDALATGLTITKAAEQAGIARKTAYNWLETEPVRAALDARRRELAARVADRVAELGQISLTAIMEYIGSDEKESYNAPSRVKLAVEMVEKMGLLARPAAPGSEPRGSVG